LRKSILAKNRGFGVFHEVGQVIRTFV